MLQTEHRVIFTRAQHLDVLEPGSIQLVVTSLPLILWRKQTNSPTKFMGSGMLPPCGYVTLEHEFILIFRKGNRRGFEKVSDKNTRTQSALFWEERNRWFSDVWDFKGTRQLLEHRTSRERSAAYPFELA
jgi:site-specific DNA-methyltransferase (cytosine-N4-specific)